MRQGATLRKSGQPIMGFNTRMPPPLFESTRCSSAASLESHQMKKPGDTGNKRAGPA